MKVASELNYQTKSSSNWNSLIIEYNIEKVKTVHQRLDYEMWTLTLTSQGLLASYDVILREACTKCTYKAADELIVISD